ncbi:homeobox-like domain superfamily [Holotrichia oblita]|uniref:Homeobox-like domain superfamily n=1 Tax=Holotrichia oblita TaxID=644536 RepID=A0ACB9TE34_HOLOL|nr:homeobox-like domain superfamily [Holotrichia oblita]
MASYEVVRECPQIITVLLKEKLRGMLCDMNKNCKKRRSWVKQWILRRNRLGASETFLKELALKDKEGYRNHLRMSEERFAELLSKVQDCIKKQDIVMRLAIPPKLKLQVTLRYLATGDSFSTLAPCTKYLKITFQILWAKFIRQYTMLHKILLK